MITDENIRDIIKHYFDKCNVLTDHHISSYNDLIDNILPNIIHQFFPIIINSSDNIFKRITLDIKDIKLVYPTHTENNGTSTILTPKIARLRNYTYSLSIIVKISIQIIVYENNLIINNPEKIIDFSSKS